MELDLTPVEHRSRVHLGTKRRDVHLVLGVHVELVNTHDTHRVDREGLLGVGVEDDRILALTLDSDIHVGPDVDGGFSVAEAHEVTLQENLGIGLHSELKGLGEDHPHRRPQVGVKQLAFEAVPEAQLGVEVEDRLDGAVGAAAEGEEAAERALVVELQLELEARLNRHGHVADGVLDPAKPFRLLKFLQMLKERELVLQWELVLLRVQVEGARGVHGTLDTALDCAVALEACLPHHMRACQHPTFKVGREVEEASSMSLDEGLLDDK
mmetsp:Transcript_22742/g.36575  ORF Transcript_22742/g.36575 Transcript_22742/m.36575 type:complete len:268 (-) Transcript_22742:982-1785(-)